MKNQSSTLTVTLVQSDIRWEDRSANLEIFGRKLREANTRMEVVLLPEMFNTGFTMNPAALAESMNGPTVEWMASMASELRIVIAGSIIIEEDGCYYNRLIWMLPGGQCWHYDKRHLFGYAGEDKYFTPGKKRVIASVKGWKLNLLVCYDLRFPVWSRQSRPIDDGMVGNEQKSALQREVGPKPDDPPFDPEYDILVYVASWPERRRHAWSTLLQARAIENQCYVAGVNRVGRDGNDIVYRGESMIVDPQGNIAVTAGETEGIVTCALTLEQLQGTRGRLPFLRDADPFLIGS